MSYGSKLQKATYDLMPGTIKDLFASLYGYREKSRRYGAAYDQFHREAKEFQRISNDRLNEICLERLLPFLARAQKTSPYHAHAFKAAGFDASTATSLEDLRRLPLLPKETVRRNLSEIISTDPGKDVHSVHTSGTTGTSLAFPETIECFQREYAYRFQNYEEGGAFLGDRWAFCAGHPVAASTRTSPPFWVRDHANKWLLMSSAHLTEKNIPGYVRELERFAPVLIGGYPSSVYLLAVANQHLGCPVKPKAIFTASETLMPHQRAAIEKSFGVRPRSYYGNAERCGFFAECEHGVFHVRQEHTYIEVLRDDGTPAGPGQEGKVVATGYGNPATPFIRYVVGDIARVSANQTCRCGRGGLLLDEVIGRVEDYILTPDGRFLGRLDHLFKSSNRVRLAQLYQEKVDALEIRIVRTPEYGASDEAEIMSEARLRLGNEIAINIRYVDDIERTKAGKFRFVVSKVPKKEFLGAQLN